MAAITNPRISARSKRRGIMLLLLIPAYIAYLFASWVWFPINSSTIMGQHIFAEVNAGTSIEEPHMTWIGAQGRSLVDFVEVTGDHQDGIVIATGCVRIPQGVDLLIKCNDREVVTVLNVNSQVPGTYRILQGLMPLRTVRH